jgi:hypothetical protein
MNIYDATENAYRNGYEKAKQDVAKEIFAAIEEIISSDEIDDELKYDEFFGASIAISRIGNKIAELKKKYTKDEDNG